MKIAVTDANIFIDLFYLEQTAHLFGIQVEVYTTQYVLNELDDDQNRELQKFVATGLLCIEVLNEQDYAAMSQIRQNRGLSESDLSVLCLAERIGATVLSGDDKVRKTCHTLKIGIHGILWCLDQFVIHKHISPEEACVLLKQLMDFNPRLPSEHCKEYITAKWKGEFD